MSAATATVESISGEIRRDPVRWVEQTFDERPLFPKAETLMRALSQGYNRVYCRACFDSSKTWTVARLAYWWLYGHPFDSIVVTTAPIWKQVEELIWNEMASAYGRARVPLGGKLTSTKFVLGPKWYAIGLSTKNEWNLSGYHARHVLVIVDEADGLEAGKWNALEGLLTSRDCALVAIGNPLDETSEFAKRSKNDARKAGTLVMKIEAKDVLAVSAKYPFLLQQEWVDDKAERWGVNSALYIGKVLAEWPSQGIDRLIPMRWLLAARDRQVPRGGRTLGVDVARFGLNKTVRTLMEGGWWVWSRAAAMEDTYVTAGRVIADMNDYGPLATAVDDTGVGGGVTDALRHLAPERTVLAINNGSKANDDARFADLGSELYWHTRKGFEDGTIGLSMEDPEMLDELINDLNRPTYELRDRGRIKVDKLGLGHGKTEHTLTPEQRAAVSPDIGDSFNLAFNAARPYLAAADARTAELLRAKRSPKRTLDGLVRDGVPTGA